MPMNKELNDHLFNILVYNHQTAMATQMAHWLTTGKTFSSWHELFEDHYKKLLMIVDEVAEGILMFDGQLSYNLHEYNYENMKLPVDALDQVRFLDKCHRICVEYTQTGADVAGQQGNQVLVDLLINHHAQHQKILWYYKNLVA